MFLSVFHVSYFLCIACVQGVVGDGNQLSYVKEELGKGGRR